jgi:DHA1 family multidrug resistance protein-like MFS transporter
MYIGNIVGPLLGSFIAGISSYSMVFIVTAAIVVLNLILFNFNVVRNLAK